MPNINERMATLETLMRENQKTLYRIHEAVYGNGKPGLIAEVQTLRHTVQAHGDSHKSTKIDWQWLATSVIAVAAIITAIVK